MKMSDIPDFIRMFCEILLSTVLGVLLFLVLIILLQELSNTV